MASFGKRETCFVCSKTVYFSERLAADGKVFHKPCFRCAHCNGVLKLGNYAALKGNYYCKPHFKQLFLSKGNYNEGFGEEKQQHQWAAKNQGSGTVKVETENKFVSSPSTPAASASTPAAPAPTPAASAPAASAPTPASDATTPAVSASAPVEQPKVEQTSKFVQDASPTPAPKVEATSKFVGGGAAVPVQASSETPSAAAAAAAPAPAASSADDMAARMAKFQQSAPAETKPASTAAPAASGGSRFGNRFGSREVCHSCGKRVYAMDMIKADDKVFHKACFRCSHCNGVIKLGNFAALNGNLYCKPHFKQLFKSKGNYSESFGQADPKAKWAPQAVF